MPETPPSPPLLARRWIRIALGLALFGCSALLALGSYFLPYVVITAGARTFPVTGPMQTANLHLVLVATGAIGAGYALAYALGRRPLRLVFFGVGGIALGVAGFLLLDASHEVQAGWIRDPTLYALLQRSGGAMRLGGALWAALAAALSILGLAVVVLRAARAATPPPAAPRRTRF